MSSPLNAISHSSTTSPLFDGKANQPTSGQFRGENVRLESSPKSMLASAAEEMTFMRAEKKELDLSKRKISDKSIADTDDAEKIRSYLDKAKDLDQEKQLKPFLSQLKKEPNLDQKQLKSMLLQQFKDPSQQYISLLFIKNQLQKNRRNKKLTSGEQAILASVESLLDELTASSGEAITAGLNISGIASKFSSEKLGSINNLRQFYRDSVLDYGGLSATFRSIIEEHGDEDFMQSLLFLIKALGADIASEGPSVPKERLQMIVDDMYKLQSLGSLYDECDEFLSQIARLYSLETPLKNATLMEKLLELIEKKWVTGNKIASLCEQLSLTQEGLDIYFLRGLKELIRAIPIKAFNDPFDREKLNSAAQDALDGKIDEEEARLEKNDQ